MTKPALLLLALYGLGDDDFRVRQASERYLEGSYAAVVFNRAAGRLGLGLQARATLRRLEMRYYAVWDAELLKNDWRRYPSLAALDFYCYLDSSGAYGTRFPLWCCRWHQGLGRVVRHYALKAQGLHDLPRPRADIGRDAVWRVMRYRAATLELCKGLRRRGAPRWAAPALLCYLRWRVAWVEWRDRVKEPSPPPPEQFPPPKVPPP